MKYQGSKRRIFPRFKDIILEHRRGYYVEPFVGGCNSMSYVNGPRIGADNNKYLIAMWQALQSGWLPPEWVSEDLYQAVFSDPTSFDPALVGFIGYTASWGGKWFGGYARRDYGRNPIKEGRRDLLAQIGSIKNVEFVCCDYRELEIPKNSVIYCDPPYRGTSGYYDGFDHDQFWVWAWKQRNIFVSEYTAPHGWFEVASYEHRGFEARRVEKLFTNEKPNKVTTFLLKD